MSLEPDTLRARLSSATQLLELSLRTTSRKDADGWYVISTKTAQAIGNWLVDNAGWGKHPRSHTGAYRPPINNQATPMSVAEFLNKAYERGWTVTFQTESRTVIITDSFGDEIGVADVWPAAASEALGFHVHAAEEAP